MSEGNGKSFADFESLSTEQKLNYIYIELVEQKNQHNRVKQDLRWYVTIFGGILLALYEFGKAIIKRKFGVVDG